MWKAPILLYFMTAFLYTATEKILQFCTRLQHTFSLDGRSPSCKGLLVMDKLTWWTAKFGFSTRGRFSCKMYDQHSAWHGGDSHRLLYRILEPMYGYFRRNQWKSRRSTSMSSIGWSDDHRAATIAWSFQSSLTMTAKKTTKKCAARFVLLVFSFSSFRSLTVQWMHSKRCYKICICSAIIG